MAYAHWWEQRERETLALLPAALSAGVAPPSVQDAWDEFNAALAEPPIRRSQDELALRRALGVAG